MILIGIFRILLATGPVSQDKQAPEYKGKTDNEIDQNIGNDNDAANKIFKGIQKLIVGLTLTKIGISLTQFFISSSVVLVADDATGVGVIDDVLVAGAVAGAILSGKAALEGVLLAGDGLADVISGAKDISNNNSKGKQGAATSPSPLPPDQDDENKSSRNKPKEKGNPNSTEVER